MKRFTPYLIGMLIGVIALGAFSIGQVSAAPMAATGCFPDTNGHWAETFVCWLKDGGVTSGYGDGTYRPENGVTRAEMAVFLQKIFGLADASAKAYSDSLVNTPPSTGNFVVNVGPAAWVKNGSSTASYITYFTNTAYLRSTAAGNFGYQADVSVPSLVYGRYTILKSARLCYTASATAVLDSVHLQAFGNSNGSGTAYSLISDVTDRTDSTCRTYTIESPINMITSDHVNLFITVQLANPADIFQVSSASFTFSPSTIVPLLADEPEALRPAMPGLPDALPGSDTGE